MEVTEAATDLPFQEASEFFRQKLELPTNVWTDVLREHHDKAFVVAGAAKMDLLAAFKTAVQEAIDEGTTLEQFREQFDEIAARHGWDFRGSAGWRSRTIYQTNMRTAHQAGRFEQMQAVKSERPYWLYRHGGSVNPRELHLSWDGLVLHADDPWWDSHYPPNGWGCSCGAFTLSEADVERRGLEIAEKAPDDGTYEWTNPNTGEIEDVPKGIDPGWNYTPGRSWTKSQTPEFVDEWPTNVGDIPEHVRPELPEPRRATSDLLLNQDEDDETYARAFLRELGADVGEPNLFEDKAGEIITISDDLLRTASGEWKASKRGRGPYMRLLARTVREPDEIWVALEPYRKKPNRWIASRYYVARWLVGEDEVPALAIFQWTKKGWHGVTAFDAGDQKRLEKRRNGLLLYSREE